MIKKIETKRIRDQKTGRFIKASSLKKKKDQLLEETVLIPVRTRDKLGRFVDVDLKPTPKPTPKPEAKPEAKPKTKLVAKPKTINKKSSNSKILFVCSELQGLVKTGGLGDVASSLSKALRKNGHDVRVVMPYYSKLFEVKEIRRIVDLTCQPGTNKISFALIEAEFQGLKLYLIENHYYFGRSRLYDDNFKEYGDNPERFSFLASAALRVAEYLEFYPDWLHLHDWQTALASLYLKRLIHYNKNFQNTKSILTVHNGFFQGKCSAYFKGFLGLGGAFNPDEFEEFGHINILKGGIHFADKVTTVSPGYANELLTAEGGHGLSHLYKRKVENFIGILNGCDREKWNPQTDKFIAKNYSAENLSGKQDCKRDILEYYGLKPELDVPLLGIVSRLTEQKGMHYTIPALMGLLQMNVKLVAIGDGNLELINGMQHLKQLFPTKVGWYHGYNEMVAHKIEAGADLFLMPSLFEPCGLNQLYSQIYGTLPIVRRVGGLKDTVINCDLEKNQGTGFCFDLPNSESLYHTVTWALDIFHNEKEHFNNMIKTAMNIDFSWEKAVKLYEQVYQDQR